MNLKTINNFLSEAELNAAIEYVTAYKPLQKVIENKHIKEINDHIRGFSILKDLSNTEVSGTVSRFQGDNTKVDEIPDVFLQIKDKISQALAIRPDNVFFQCISINSGGKVSPHYDAGYPGFITYKCNINLAGPSNDTIHIDKTKVVVNNNDLYCFEANLYRHWVDTSASDRQLLSYGFMVPYADLGWREDSPRIKLSNRIWKAFIRS